jgi:hypothetical protein
VTLIIYKNNTLAADTRGTLQDPHAPHGLKCAHCNEPAFDVIDNSDKLVLIPVDKEIRFQGSKVLAIGQAGNRELTKRLINLVLKGDDLQDAFRAYAAFHGNTEHRVTGSLLFCTVDGPYMFDMQKKGAPIIKKYAKGDFITMGSARHVAEWLNALIPDASASHLINLVMARDKTVGGIIHEIDLTAPTLEIKKPNMKDPKSVLDLTVEMIREGAKIVVSKAEAKEKKPAPRRVRKPVELATPKGKE